MAAAPPGVELSKRTLTFALGAAVDPKDVVSIHNPTDAPHYFKVKTTNPHRYIVRPNIGLVPARGTVAVTVALHAAAAAAAAAAATDTDTAVAPVAPSAEPPAVGPSRDKFLLLAAPAPDPDIPAASFWAAPEATAAATPVKLRVVFVGPGGATRPLTDPAVAPTLPAAGPLSASHASQSTVLPDAADLMRPGNADAARDRVETLQNQVDDRARVLAARKAELYETRAETKKVLAEAPRAPLAANAIVSDPFGGVSIAAIAIFILLFAVVVMTVF